MKPEIVKEHEKFTHKNKTKYFHGTGRRKRSAANVRIAKGKGKILVNGKITEKYFNNKFAKEKILAPIVLVGKEKEFDVSVLVQGGGIESQIDAVVLGLSRALVKSDENYSQTLKKAGLLTRDSREKERMKPGLKRARKSPQWSKR
jgi:small subunit ribosomal protein S9